MNEELEVKLAELRDNEKDIFMQTNTPDNPYTMKMFEILEGEIREVEIDESEKFAANPGSFSEAVQRKYAGIALKDLSPQEGFSGPVPEGFEEFSVDLQNPFTLEPYSIRQIREIPKITIEEKIQIIKNKLAQGIATKAEIKELKLLIS